MPPLVHSGLIVASILPVLRAVLLLEWWPADQDRLPAGHADPLAFGVLILVVYLFADVSTAHRYRDSPPHIHAARSEGAATPVPVGR